MHTFQVRAFEYSYDGQSMNQTLLASPRTRFINHHM